MKNEIVGFLEVKLEIIKSLTQTKENWFGLLSEKITTEDKEFQSLIIDKIDEIDEKILDLNNMDNAFSIQAFNGVQQITKRVEVLEKNN